MEMKDQYTERGTSYPSFSKSDDKKKTIGNVDYGRDVKNKLERVFVFYKFYNFLLVGVRRGGLY